MLWTIFFETTRRYKYPEILNRRGSSKLKEGFSRMPKARAKQWTG